MVAVTIEAYVESEKSSWEGEWSFVRSIRPLITPETIMQGFAPSPRWCFSQDNFLLETEGILNLKRVKVDVVKHVEEAIDTQNEDWEERLRKWEPESPDTWRFPTGEIGIDTYWRTLVKDSSRASSWPGAERISAEQVLKYRELFLVWFREEKQM